MKITIIAAASDNAVIGKDNKLLWNLPDDMKFFKSTHAACHLQKMWTSKNSPT